MLIGTERVFRRRLAGFIVASTLFYIIFLIILRFSYRSIVYATVKAECDARLELAHSAAAAAQGHFEMISKQVAELAGAIHTHCPGDSDRCLSLLSRQYALLAQEGVLDLVFLDRNGGILASPRKFFSQHGQEGWPPEVSRTRDDALNAKTPGVLYTKVFVHYDETNKERPAFVMAAPVFGTYTVTLTPEPPAEAASGTASGTAAFASAPIIVEKRGLIGALVVPMGFLPVSAKIQAAVPKNAARTMAMFGPEDRILSYPDPAYVGTGGREVFNLAQFPKFDNIISRSVDGHSGAEDFDYSEEQGAAEQWWMSYDAAKTPAGSFGVGVFGKQADMPLVNAFVWKYAAAAVIVLVLIALINVLPTLEHSRHLSTYIELKRMRDTHAINEMLRNVNQELTEAKRALENRTREVQALQDQRRYLLDQLTHTQYRLFGTIKKPSREQRELMRALKRDVQAMERSPGARFWKKAPDNEEE